MPSVFQPVCCPDESQCGRHHGATLPTKLSLPFSFSFCRAASAFQFPLLGSAGNLCGNSGESMVEVHSAALCSVHRLSLLCGELPKCMATGLCPVLIAQEGGEACARGATPPISLLISKSLLFL